MTSEYAVAMSATDCERRPRVIAAFVVGQSAMVAVALDMCVDCPVFDFLQALFQFIFTFFSVAKLRGATKNSGRSP